MSAAFKGSVDLQELGPPNSYRIVGQGNGGIAGFAKGGAAVQLTESEGGTLLTYTANAQIGSKLASFGARLIQSTSKKLADQFFSTFAAEMSAAVEPSE